MRDDNPGGGAPPAPGRSARALALALALGGSLALGACGGGGDESASAPRTTAGANGDRGAVAACLKEKGIELPQRPDGAGRGAGGSGGPPGGPGGQAPDGAGGPPAGGPPDDLAGDGLPGGGPPVGTGTTRTQRALPGGGMSDEQREAFRKALEACGGRMGGRGGPGAPRGAGDAGYRRRVQAYVTCVRKNGYDLPDPDFSGNGPIFDPDDVDRDDATFRKASAACQSELRPSREQGADDDARERPGGSSS